MTADRFCVYQFFPDGTHEKVREFVPAEEAVAAAHHYSHSVGARLGTTVRVIITDAGDCTCFEWKFGEGVISHQRSHIMKGREEDLGINELALINKHALVVDATVVETRLLLDAVREWYSDVDLIEALETAHTVVSQDRAGKAWVIIAVNPDKE